MRRRTAMVAIGMGTVLAALAVGRLLPASNAGRTTSVAWRPSKVGRPQPPAVTAMPFADLSQGETLQVQMHLVARSDADGTPPAGPAPAPPSALPSAPSASPTYTGPTTWPPLPTPTLAMNLTVTGSVDGSSDASPRSAGTLTGTLVYFGLTWESRSTSFGSASERSSS